MKNVVIIPIKADNPDQLKLPLSMRDGKTLLETVYESAKATMIDDVVVTSNSSFIGKFCKERGIAAVPSSKDAPNATVRCAEVAARFKPGIVKNVICWPISYPYIPPYTIEEMIGRHKEDRVTTCIFNIQKCHTERFLADPSMVKVRAFHSKCADFTRCPLLGSQLHVGVYLYSVEQLGTLGRIDPTILSIEERLEQLSWLQFGVRIDNVLWRDKTYTDFPPRVLQSDLLEQEPLQDEPQCDLLS